MLVLLQIMCIVILSDLISVRYRMFDSLLKLSPSLYHGDVTGSYSHTRYHSTI